MALGWGDQMSGDTADFLERRNGKTGNAPVNRAPPHSVEAEQGALGSMMMDRNALAMAADRLTTEHFFLPQHQMIFAALSELFRENKGIDFITVTEFLKDENLLESVGGPGYVTEIGTF